MANEAIDIIITKKAREELIATREEITKTDAEFIKLANDINAFAGKSPFPKLPREYEARLRESSQWTAQLNANNAEAAKLANALTRQKARLAQLETQNAKALAKERLETQLLNKALKDEAILSSRLVGEYKKLSLRRNQSIKAIKDEIALNGKNSKALKGLRSEFKKLDKRYLAANRATRDFRDNVGNYKSAIGGATGALRLFIGVFGIYSGLQIAREIYDQIKAIDGMNKALLQVTGTQEAFNQAQFFLSQTADEAGANIIGLTSSYTKFLASAKTTNLSLDDTQNIFRQVAKAAGVLGLSTDDTNGSFRALEQILSKGKVQAEEIRGQLGERLPGAFQILAKSMGLTTAELSKQLELGNVLSEEVLPGFAAELERTYSLDKVGRVETLAAAQQRLGNAWTQFLQSVENGEGTITRVLGGMLEFLESSVKGFTILFKSVEQLNEEFDNKKGAESFKKEMEAMQGAAADTGQTLKEVASQSFFRYTKSVEAAREEVARLKEEQKGIDRTIDVGRGVRVANPAYEKQNDLIEKANIALAIREGRLEAVNSVLRNTNKETKENTENLEDNNNKIDEGTRKLEKYARVKSVGFGFDIPNAPTGAFDNVEGGTFSFGVDAIDAPDTDEFTEALQKMAKEAFDASDGITTKFEENSKLMEDIFSGTFSTFEDYYGVDLSAFTKMLQGKEASLDDYASFAKSATNAVLESILINYENELIANEERLNTILSDENASEAKKKQAKLEADKKEKEVRTKQAKAERKAALVQIGIDTAVGIVKATSLGFPAAIPVIALVAALGLAQTAFVASQPLPQFAEGTDNAPAGKAVTDELGPELRVGRDGEIKSLGSTKGARIQKLDAGDRIYTAAKTRDIYKNALLSDNQIKQDAIDMAIIQSVTPQLDLTPLRGMMQEEIRDGFKKVRIINNNNYSQPTTGYRA